MVAIVRRETERRPSEARMTPVTPTGRPMAGINHAIRVRMPKRVLLLPVVNGGWHWLVGRPPRSR